MGGHCFFQADDGIREAQESRGLGDVYKRQRFGQVMDGPTSRPVADFHEFFLVFRSIRSTITSKFSISINIHINMRH